MRFRFLHAADLHLDTPFQGLARASEEAAALLRDASLDAFDRLVDVAIENEVAFVLLAGDLYDGEVRGVRAQLRFLRGLERLSERGVKTFIVHGNHDPLGGWSAVREWPAGVTVFGAEEVGEAPVEVDGVCIATVYGISYGRRDTEENLALRFPSTRDGGAGGFRVGLLHCTVGDQADHAPYSPCSLADLTTKAIDYWALGHIHRAAVLREGDPWVVYPGNTQGRSPKPSESGVKGAMLVEVDGRVVRSVDLVPTDAARFLDLEIDLAGLGAEADVSGLQAELFEQCAGLREEHPGRASIIRAVLVGRGPLHADLARADVREGLLQDLRDAVVGLEPLVWWEGLRDHTAPEIDLDVVRARDDFTSSVLAHADRLRDDPQALADLAGSLGPDRPVEMARRCPSPHPDEVARLLEAAALLAVEALENEAPPCI